MKLYNKYIIRKNEGPTDPNAVYFVLRIDTDPAARRALVAYALSINDPEFSAELLEMAEKYENGIEAA